MEDLGKHSHTREEQIESASQHQLSGMANDIQMIPSNTRQVIGIKPSSHQLISFLIERSASPGPRIGRSLELIAIRIRGGAWCDIR
jgi:hypothetical protein